MKKRIALCLAAVCACLPVFGQEQDHTADSLRHVFGRQEVKPNTRMGTKYADTLDTGNPAVKVVLYDNGTYRYVKDPSAVADTTLFTEFWDERAVNPYHQSPDPIPDQFSIWVLDSLDTYCCPYQTTVRSKFGYRHGRRHQGVDLPYPTGTPVPAAFSGKVRISDYVGGYGNLVVIRHASGLETFYAHLSKRNVNSGDWVSAGDIIGLGGSTGRSTGPHLHFETRYRGAAFCGIACSKCAAGTSIPTSAMSRTWTTKTRFSVRMRKTASWQRKKPRKRLQPVPVQRLLRRNTTPSAAATPCPASPRSIIPR